MKYVVAGVLAVLAAAGATLLASRRVEALADLTRPVLSGTTLAAVAFAVAGLAVVGGVALLTAPARRATAAVRTASAADTGPLPPVAEPDPLTEPFTIPAPRSGEPQAPDGVAPEGVVPEGVAPNGVVPEGVVPEGVAPDGVVPDGDDVTSPAPVDPDAARPAGAGAHRGAEGSRYTPLSAAATRAAPTWAGSTGPSRHGAADRVPSWSGRS